MHQTTHWHMRLGIIWDVYTTGRTLLGTQTMIILLFVLGRDGWLEVRDTVLLCPMTPALPPTIIESPFFQIHWLDYEGVATGNGNRE